MSINVGFDASFLHPHPQLCKKRHQVSAEENFGEQWGRETINTTRFDDRNSLANLRFKRCDLFTSV